MGVVDEYPEIQGICNAREAMEKLPEEERRKSFSRWKSSRWRNEPLIER